MIIGFIGTFFGNLIKAAVSRQREYLADATAVKYTRNPDGIAGALKRIGGLTLGSELKNPGANEISHLFFSQGASGFMQVLSATHPPLDKRIRRIEPGWDGKFDFTANFDLPQTEENHRKKEAISRDKSADKVAMAAGSVVIADVANAINQIGNPEPETFNLANFLITGLPVVIKEAAHEAYGARAVIYYLALDRDEDVRSKQLEFLKKYANQDVYNLILRLHPEMEKLDIKYRLPVIDIAMPALKQLSLNQYQIFKGNIVKLIKLSPKIKLMEWSLQKIIFTHLDAQFFKLAQKKINYLHIEHLKKEIELILSVMVYAGHPDENNIEAAFKEAAENMNLNDLKLVAKDKINLLNLENSVKKWEA